MPWIAGLIAAGAAVAGAVINSKNASDSAEKQQKFAADHTFDKSGLYDPNKFNYGGNDRAAADFATAYDRQGAAVQQRAATQADYTAANSFAGVGNQDASSQRQAADLMMARANGSTPSIAQMQADRQMQQNVAAQASQAASARGAAGLALAGQTAATNIANGSAAISAQAQINAASERLQAEQGANSAYSGLRSGDLASQQQAAQQSQYQAQLTAQQKAMNDQITLAEQQNAIGVRNSQLQAGIAQQGMLAGNNQAFTSAALAIQQQNAANQQANTQRAAAAIGTVASTAASIPSTPSSAPKTDSSTSNNNNVNATAGANQAYAVPREKGGPVAPGQPYLVGEKGPELIVPKRDGVVIPAGPTSSMLGATFGFPARADGGPIHAGGVPNRLSQALAYQHPAPAATVPLGAPDGKELHQSLDGHAFYNDAPITAPSPVPTASIASSGGPETAAPALMARKKVATPAQARKMTPEEMLAAADKEIASLKADTARRDAEGPALRRAGGGDASNGFNTQLTQGAEQAYRGKFGENSDRDYDLRGAFAAGLTDGAKTARAPDGSAYFPDHLPDTYKKPNHETFSNESQYAQYAPDRAGSWNGERYISPATPAQPSPGGTPAPAAATAQLQQALASDPEKANAFKQGLLSIVGSKISSAASPADATAQIQQLLANDPQKAAAFKQLVIGVMGPSYDSSTPMMSALGGRPSTGAPPMLAARSRGGPVTRRVPYLVGENGPELVMPMLAPRRTA